MRSPELQNLMNEFKQWDWVNDNEKVYHEDTVYEMLLHLKHRMKQKLNIASVSGKRPTQIEIDQAVKDYLIKVGNVDRMDIIEHDFREGIAWLLQFHQAACASSAVDTVAEREPFDCYEIHRPNIPANGCKTQCEECAAWKSSEGQP